MKHSGITVSTVKHKQRYQTEYFKIDKSPAFKDSAVRARFKLQIYYVAVYVCQQMSRNDSTDISKV